MKVDFKEFFKRANLFSQQELQLRISRIQGKYRRVFRFCSSKFPLAELYLTPNMMHYTQKHKLYNFSSFSSQDPTTFHNI